MNFDEMMLHPAQCFATPDDVLCHPELSKQEKTAILTQWKNEAMHEREGVAEGLPGNDASVLLQQINEKIERLGK